MTTSGEKARSGFWVQLVPLLMLLFLFMSSVNMMGSGFKLMGGRFAESLLSVTSNPFAGLLIGVIMTAIVQSSSLTTTMIVGMVGTEMLPIDNAVPMVMGANIGTTITCTLVALSYVGRRGRFRRAFAAGTMHDVFNILCVIILLPVECATHVLRKTAVWLANHFADVTGFSSPRSPIKVATGKLAGWLEHLLVENAGMEDKTVAIIMIVAALALLFFSLFYLTKFLKGFMAQRMEMVLDRYIFRNALTALLVGLVFTAVVQSSSVTTSIMVPLVTAGVLTHAQAFPYMMGANVGTTVTGILAALGAGNPAGLAIAFVHTIFNLTGVAIFLPVKRLRNIPVALSKLLANATLRSRWWAVFYMVTMFFVIPVLGIFGWRWIVRLWGAVAGS